MEGTTIHQNGQNLLQPLGERGVVVSRHIYKIVCTYLAQVTRLVLNSALARR